MKITQKSKLLASQHMEQIDDVSELSLYTFIIYSGLFNSDLITPNHNGETQVKLGQFYLHSPKPY